MSTVEQAPPGTVDDTELRPLLRQAQRTWRRAGVLPAERRRLGEELHGELVAAAEAGRAPSLVRTRRRRCSSGPTSRMSPVKR